MKSQMTIVRGGHYYYMDTETGNISSDTMEESKEWRVVGAVKYNNFGHITARAYLADIVAGNINDWTYRNGKQKWHVMDYDHGTHRIWNDSGMTHQIY